MSRLSRDGRRIRSPGRRAAWLVALVVGVVQVAPILAQEELDVPDSGDGGFALHKDDPSIVNALEDIDRYAEQGAWDKVVRSVSTVLDAEPEGLVPWKDGFLLPARQVLRHKLLALDPAGREAFRLFFNPKAQQRFDEWRAARDKTGQADLVALAGLVDSYFITDVGDDMADMLAELQLKQGAFESAADLWGEILAHCPDSDLPVLRLEIKRATALARAGRWSDFAAADERIRERYRGQTTRIGGRDMPVLDILDELAAGRPEATPAPAAPGSSLALRDQLLWKFTFTDPATASAIRDIMNQGWMISSDLFSPIPAAAADEKRVYLNWIGTCFAIDVRTGKLLWRTGPLAIDANKAMRIAQTGVRPDQASVTVAGDRVLFVALPQNFASAYNSSYHLFCLAADTGEKKWATESGLLLSWNFCGPPIVSGDTIYATALAQGGGEMSLLAIDLEKGTMRWSLAMGTPPATTDYRGNASAAAPLLVEHERQLYVLTNNGALIAVDPAAQRIAWALQYDGPPGMSSSDMMFFSGEVYQDPVVAPGQATMHDGTLYLKEKSGGALLAVDVGEPGIRWRRTLTSSDTIVSVGDEQMLVLGTELSAIDLDSRDMRWSTRVPMRASKINALVTPEAAWVLTARGLFGIDPQTGRVTNVVRTEEEGAMGGMLLRAGDRLIWVSNIGIGAYPLADPSITRTDAPAGHTP